MKKQVLVSVDRGETRVALLEATGTVPAASPRSGPAAARKTANPAAGYQVAELYLERRGARSIVGNIYKGRVDNVLAGLEAAFVDIGLEKNGFLHVDEIVLPGVEAPRRGRGGGRDGRQITDMLKPGQEIVVQVVKDPLKTKGARLSMDLTIAGRYMVYAPFGEGVGVSRRLDDKERERLRKEAAKLDLQGGGAIIRTAAHGAKRADLERELLYLFKLDEVLAEARRRDRRRRRSSSRRPTSRCASCATSSPTTSSGRSSTTPSSTTGSSRSSPAPRPSSSTASSCGRASSRCSRPTGSSRCSTRRCRRRVDLPSGGYLMIDYAEALTVIDVNSGSFIGRGKGARLEDTITKTNLEAADEVVRQLRLRDIGGIIVIDFIDMARARNRDAVLKTLRKALDEDRTKTFVVEISPLGLVEMTRQNVTEGVREIMTRPCPTCDGEGVIKSEETIAIEFERRMRDLAKETQGRGVPDPDEPARQRRVHRQRRPRAARDRGGDRQVVPLRGLRGPAARPLRGPARGRPRAGARAGAARSARARRSTSRSSSRTCTAPATRSPRSTATSSPCAAATPLVGEKRMVRIEEVGRTGRGALRSSMPTRTAAETARTGAAADDEDDGLESKPRRRGRRGGRRRSGAKAESASTGSHSSE